MVYQNGKLIAMSLASSREASQDIYSTEEQVIGKWIDGKPLYRKVFVATSPSKTNSGVVIGDNQDFDNVTNIYGILIAKDGSRNAINMYYDSTASICTYVSSNYVGNKVVVKVTHPGDNYLSRPVYVVVEYTKTTDVADDESASVNFVSKPVLASGSYAKDLSVSVLNVMEAPASSAKDIHEV